MVFDFCRALSTSPYASVADRMEVALDSNPICGLSPTFSWDLHSIYYFLLCYFSTSYIVEKN